MRLEQKGELVIPIAEDLIKGGITSLWLHMINIVIESLFENKQIEETILKTADFEKIIEEKIDFKEVPEISEKSIRSICDFLYKSEDIKLLIKQL